MTAEYVIKILLLWKVKRPFFSYVGLGYSDVENRIPCTADTVMRAGSISKPLGMTVIAKLMEAGLVDIDLPVKKYVKNWPTKKFDGKEVL